MQLSRLVPLATAAVAIAAGPASAYTVKTTSSGAPVHWTSTDVAFVPAFEPGPATVSTTDAKATLATSAGTWATALTDAGVSVKQASTTATAAPHDNDGVNTVRWALDSNDPDIERGVLALTFVAFRTADGAIADADVVLNAADFTWTTDISGCSDDYDLQSALTHELGHAVGMAHSAGHPEATMYATGDACETLKRDLAPDDLAGLAVLYPAMAAGSDGGGCAVGGGSGGWGLILLGAAVFVARKRRARIVAVAGLVIGFGSIRPADASQLRKLELAELGQDAAMVVRGHVIAVTALPGEAIETDSEVVVDSCLAGDCPATVHVVRRGGERDGMGVWVDGEAAPAAGDDVVLYLRSDPHGRLRVLGGVQGLLHVVASPAGPVAVRDLRGHHILVDHTWQAGGVEAVALDRLARSLAALRASPAAR